MAYPRAERLMGEWKRGGGARFVRTLAGQDWELHVAPGGWVTVAQAATLLGVSVQLVGEWIRSDRIDPREALGKADDGITMLRLAWVRAVFEANQGPRRVGPTPR